MQDETRSVASSPAMRNVDENLTPPLRIPSNRNAGASRAALTISSSLAGLGIPVAWQALVSASFACIFPGSLMAPSVK